MIVSSLKLKEIDVDKYYQSHCGYSREIFIGENLIDLQDFPKIELKNKTIYYAQIGMVIFIIEEDNDVGITTTYSIEQGIVGKNMKIENIYVSTHVSPINPLEKFFKYDLDYEKNNKEKLLNLIDEINVIIEKSYLKKKINEYYEENEENEEKIGLIKENGKMYYNAKPIDYNGERYNSMTEFAKEIGYSMVTVSAYLKKGMTIEEIAQKAKTKRNVVRNKNVYKGKHRPNKEIAEMMGIGYSTLMNKLSQGKTIEQIENEFKNRIMKMGVKEDEER